MKFLISGLHYLGKISRKLKMILEKQNIRLAFKTNNNQGYINNNKSKTNTRNRSGVYSVYCGACLKLILTEH